MPRNNSQFGEIGITPLSGQFDLRSPSGRLNSGDFRVILNSSMNEAGKRCRRSGWKKLFADSENGFNNQDLHNQLIGSDDDSAYVIPPETSELSPDCTCPSGLPTCFELDGFNSDDFASVVDGEDSTNPAWNGVISYSDTCSWGFSFGQYSLLGKDLAVVLALVDCSPSNVYQLSITTKSGNDSQFVLFRGTRAGWVVGTYTKTEGCYSGSVSLSNCNECERPSVEFFPPSGSDISSGTYVSMSSAAGARIYYTTDGSMPDDNSTEYTAPIQIDDSTLNIKAVAYLDSCVGDVYSTSYTLAALFSFRYLCLEGRDEAGVFGEFAPNGDANDYVWQLNFNSAETIDINRLEIYETDSDGNWITGQAWATDNPVYPPETNGIPFAIYPLVVRQDGSNINSDYEEVLVSDKAPGSYVWSLYGQPFIPATGFFKLKFYYTDAEGAAKTIYAMSSSDCEYCEYGEYGDYCLDENPENLINIDVTPFGTAKTGAAAVGVVGDFWNSWVPPTVPEEIATSITSDLKYADGTSSGASIEQWSEVDDGIEAFENVQSLSHPDDMMQVTARTFNQGYLKGMLISDLPRGTYDVYVYGHGSADDEVLKCEIQTPLTSYPSQQTAVGTGWSSPTWVEGEQYVVFRDVTFSDLEAAEIMVSFTTDLAVYFVSGIQLHKKS